MTDLKNTLSSVANIVGSHRINDYCDLRHAMTGNLLQYIRLHLQTEINAAVHVVAWTILDVQCQRGRMQNRKVWVNPFWSR
jgi:hypothetical protein